MATNNKLHGAKRILSAITAVLVAATTFSAMAVTSAAEDEIAVIDQTVVDDTDGKFTLAEDKGATSAEWTGTASSSFAGGDGSKQYPYSIFSGEHLARLANMVNSGYSYSGMYFRLEADIVLNDDVDDEPTEWNPIGGIYNGAICSFGGNFDGNGHTISGLYINSNSNRSLVGLFASNLGTISNLKVTDSKVVSGASSSEYVAIICGDNDGIITDCQASGRLTSSMDRDKFGAICGSNSNKVVNCTNKAELYISGGSYAESKEYVGGICGYNTGTIDNCVNAGRVYTTSNYIYYVGGICGKNVGGTVKNSYNTAVVTGYRFVGGVCGHNSGTVKDCYNKGNITSRATYVGGICGHSTSSAYSDIVMRCYNTGTITSADGYAGGINGGLGGYRIKDCYNTGTINGNGSWTGGVCGGTSVGEIIGCYNEGSVNSGENENVGGITGSLYKNCNIYNCYNNGNVTGGENVGGILGYSSDSASNMMSGCINTGEVSGTSNVYPVGHVNCIIENVYYDSKKCSASDSTNNSFARTTEQLTEDNALTTLGLDSEVWNKTANTTEYLYYPDLVSIEVDSQYVLAPLPAPTGVKASAGDTKVQVKWDAVNHAESYRVMVWDGSKWTGYNTTATSYMVRNLTNGKKYAFAVKAYADGTYGKTSETVYATPAVSIIPTGVKAGAGDAKVQVKWNAVTGASSYRVMVWDGAKWTGYNTTSTSYMVRNLTNNKKYAFAVKAYVNGAYGDVSTILYAVPHNATSIIPTGVKAGAGDSKVQVKWNTVYGASSYRVMVWDGTKWTGYSTTSTSYMVRNLTNGKKYAFVVKAYINGAYSNTSTTVYATPNA